jgi:flagellar biosynthetic protein FliQ
MTLSFVPKLIVVLLALALLSGYMMVELQDFFQYIFERIRDFGG